VHARAVVDDVVAVSTKPLHHLREDLRQARLALEERQAGEFLAVKEEQIEGEVDEVVRLAVVRRRLQRVLLLE